MTPHTQQILKDVLNLPPVDRAELVEKILASFEFPADKDIDNAWAKEAEDRIDAFDQGDIGSTPASDVFKEIDHQANK
ncbi:MAG: addiction module protein [Sedimentisphaerales bacterium]|nr:addiction module protein [Sedimentisphaerales bacterium]